ncbi:protein O-mannosyl-transferase TMTC1-like [Rhipicephalus microplus]|uniref:protein O-mannosyl-transferase TMTC1-like n=1 Tax=Rhipicephalus microplus TaxID=6941 RepID=UPI003F6D920E
MAVGGWLSGGAQSSLLHAYLESSASASTATALSDHSDSDRKCGQPCTWHKRCRSKTTSTADTLRALTGSLGALCASVITRMRSYFVYSARLRVASSSAVPVEDHHRQQGQSSFNCQRRPRLTQQQSQKRHDGAVGAANEPVFVGTAHKPLATWMPVLCAGVVAVLCYVNSLDGDFVHDDMVAVVGNPDVTGESRRHAASSSSSSLWINDFWGRPMADPRSHKSYRPLTVLTFRANYYVHGRQVRGYHVVNVALHCACSVLVAVVARRVMRITALHACLSSMLFAAHPVHTEAVSSIVGRAEVLCCLFFLLSFLCYHRCRLSRDVQGSHGQSKWLAASGLLSLCALLSKEQGITVLPLCMALRISTLVRDSMHTGKEMQRRKAGCWTWPVCRYCIRGIAYRCITDSELVALTTLTILLLCFRICILQGSLPEFSEMDNPAAFSSMHTTRLLTYSYLCAFNAWLLLCPRTLSYDWQMGSIPLVTSPCDCRNLATLALLTSLLALGWRILTRLKRKSSPASGSREQLCYYNNTEQPRDPSLRLLVPLLLTVLPFLPASNLFVTVGFVVAERVLYIPSIGMSLLVAEGLCRFHMRCSRVLRWCSTSICFILVLLFAARTWNRNIVWASREALFESGVMDLPGNAKVHYNYANLQKDIGNSDLAIKHYRLAIALWPNHASAHNNLGTVLTSAEESEQHFRYALNVNANHPGAHFNLANIYSKQGQKDVARALLERAVELDPDFCEAYSSLAALMAEKGDLAEAERLHQMALRSDDQNADARNNYGTFLQSHGRAEEAMAQYEQALDIQQNHTVALLNAARSLHSRNLNMPAESLYKRALAVEPDPQVMDNLAVFYVNAGRLAEARELFEDIHRRFPEHRESKAHHAQLLIQLRSFRAAEDLLLDAIEHNSTDRGALHMAALLYNHINRTVEALDYILKALKLCDVDDLRCAKIHSDHGDILKDLGDLSSSAKSYEVAIRLDSGLAHAHLNLAVIRHLESDYQGAFRHYQVAHSLEPENKLITDNMAKLRRRITRPLTPFHDCV